MKDEVGERLQTWQIKYIKYRNSSWKILIITYLTTNGSRHSCCLLMAYRLSSGILQGPSRLHATDRTLSRASQRTVHIPDHQGGSASTIKTLAGCRENKDQNTKLPELEETAGLFLLSVNI